MDQGKLTTKMYNPNGLSERELIEKYGTDYPAVVWDDEQRAAKAAYCSKMRRNAMLKGAIGTGFTLGLAHAVLSNKAPWYQKLNFRAKIWGFTALTAGTAV